MKPSERQQPAVGYLLDVLQDGARPFEYRTAVRALLGVADTPATLASAPVGALVNFAYASRTGWPNVAPTSSPPSSPPSSSTLPPAGVIDFGRATEGRAAPAHTPDARPDPARPRPPPAITARDRPPPLERPVSPRMGAAPGTDNRERPAPDAGIEPFPLGRPDGRTGLPPRMIAGEAAAPPPPPPPPPAAIPPAAGERPLPRQSVAPAASDVWGAREAPRPAPDLGPVTVHLPGVSQRPSGFPSLRQAQSEPGLAATASAAAAAADPFPRADVVPRAAPMALRLRERTPTSEPLTTDDRVVGQGSEDGPKVDLERNADRRVLPARAPARAAVPPAMPELAPHSIWSEGAPGAASVAPASAVGQRPSGADLALLARIRGATQGVPVKAMAPAATPFEVPAPAPVAPAPALPAAPVIPPRRLDRRSRLPCAYWERRLGHFWARILR